MTQIPLLRLDNSDQALVDELMEAVGRVAARGAFVMGDELEAFEAEWAAYCETEHAVGLSSGTEALALALRALEIGRGDEVIVPANSFIATAEAVTLAGATPRLVDVDPRTHLVTAEHVAAALTPRTRAVIPVHLYGGTADIDAILEVARPAGVAVVEDTAQAHGARLRGRRVGGIGDAGCFSFYPTKNLGAWGDGGAIVTDDAELAERVRLLRSHGEKPRYHHRVPGTTARLDALQAAILRIKLQRLDECNDRRRELGTRLAESLRGSSVEVVERPFEGADHVYHLFVVRSSARDQLRAHLAERGVATAVHYPFAIHRTPAYADLGLGPGSLPVSEDHANRICSLPLWPGMTLEEADTVAEAVWSFGAARPRTRFAPGSQDQTIVSRS